MTASLPYTDVGQGNSEYDGYFCIQTDIYRCACRSQPWTFVHFRRRIVVWEEKDDEAILEAAKEFKKIDLDPHIIEYNSVMGSCIDWKDIPPGDEIG